MQKLLVLTAAALMAVSVGSAIKPSTFAPSASESAPPPATITFEGLAAMP